MVHKITEDEFNPHLHVKEYKRKCNECKKVWHSLASREKEIKRQVGVSAFSTCAFCGMPGAQLQASRNLGAAQSELDRLKKCPNCGSQNYKEDVIIYAKK